MVGILERIAEAADDAAVSEVARTIDSESAAVIRTILESVPPGSWRTRLEFALNHIPH
jgi:hypothetical protein